MGEISRLKNWVSKIIKILLDKNLMCTVTQNQEIGWCKNIVCYNNNNR